MIIFNVKLNRSFLKDLILLILGVGLIVLSIQLFVLPNELASNGLAGFAVTMNFIFSTPPSLTFFLINIPIFLIGWKALKRRELLLSIPGALATSVWFLFFESIGIMGFPMSHPLIAGVLDGLLSGLGAGFILLSQGTSGGSVLLSRIIEFKWTFTFDKIHFTIDLFVLLLALSTYLTFPKFIITLFSCFIFSKTARFIGRKDYRKDIINKMGKFVK